MDKMPIITMDIDPYTPQTIKGLMDRLFDIHGYRIPDYRCEIEIDEHGNTKGCDQIGHCNQSVQITEMGDIMILQLKIYTADVYGQRSKIFPNILIDQEITRYECFKLQGIIWHHGDNWDSGHYTADVKVDDVWYSTNDTVINEGATFECNSNSTISPYIIVYKKRNNRVVPFTNAALNYLTNDQMHSK